MQQEHVTGPDPACCLFIIIIIIIIIIVVVVIGCTALGGPWPPEENVVSDFYPGQPSTDFYSPASLCLPPPVTPSSFWSATYSLTFRVCA